MLTNMSNNSISQRYAGHQIYQSHTTARALESNTDQTENRQDTVTLSTEASSLKQTYEEKEQRLDQSYSNDAKALEREYQQEKSRLQREYSQKKKNLGVSMYA
ncbi:MAG: hypothetical protein HUN04_08285 [Desulfobacter sp.]|nr:MAG: hypothetical protein HUN04_08285 [Desulfobacter sp.]